MLKKSSFVLLVLLIFTFYSFGQEVVKRKQRTPNNKALNSRSDSIDILNYEINLDVTNFSGKVIKGSCQVLFEARVDGIQTLPLDLLLLTVDSIISNGSSLTYSYNDTLIKVDLGKTVNTGDKDSVVVYYRGTPRQDASWGGFYFDNTYAFNLGVGFDSDPHNLGRVWFPCFDNFVERSTFEFNITTSGGRKAHCNGELASENTISGDTIIRSWKMKEEIPTYLACIAISDYETVHQKYQGMDASFPVELVARAADTANLKQSFVHLSNSLMIYEESYGPYLWNKIGFTLVPFQSGAMEHATNVAYPINAIDSTTRRETLMAHEFSHHWWGNLVTCETAGDMWINEGMATYSEHLFLEKLYDRNRYIEAVKSNHRDILQFAHVREGNHLALSDMPHEYTYGTHTYNKGASVAHNMRAYLEDSLFFKGLKSITDKFKFKSINATQFRDELTLATGVDMTNFFSDWIFSPGYAHYSIDSIETVSVGTDFDVSLYVQQKLKGAMNYHSGVPLEITFFDSNWKRHQRKITVSGQYYDTTLRLEFEPILTIVNEENKLNQARTDDQLLIKTSGKFSLTSSLSELTVDSLLDSALIQIEHHWVAPDPIENNTNNYRISTSRYWSVNGILPSHFDANLSIDYSGRSSSGFLDADLVALRGDSLILLYREDAKADWKEYAYYTKSSRTPAIIFGTITIDSLLIGEYAFANAKTTVGVNEIRSQSNPQFKIYPNPSKRVFWIESDSELEMNIEVYDLQGKLVIENKLHRKVKMDTGGLSSGNYILKIYSQKGLEYTDKVIVQ